MISSAVKARANWVLARLPLALALCVVATWMTSGCGGSLAAPTPGTGPVITSVVPSNGTTFGGTAVMISGDRFTAAASVSIGGIAATSVTVENAQTIKATTATHAAGVANVTVSTSDGSSTLPGAFTYMTPTVTNMPPVISGIAFRGTRPNEPSSLADLNEEVNVVATVMDVETPVDRLDFRWSATAGTFGGSGAEVTWRAPASASSTPASVTLTLVVVEVYQAADSIGLPVPNENRTTATTTVSLHDSPREAGNVAWEFLNDFSHSNVPAEAALRNFSFRLCQEGAAAELSDVENNRKQFVINSYALGQPRVSVDFASRCPFRNRRGDACVSIPCRWNSTGIDLRSDFYGKTGDAIGTCYLVAVYDQPAWRLCSSEWEGTATAARWRSFFGSAARRESEKTSR